MMKPLKATIFDFDDTLVATSVSRTEALISSAARFGFAIASTDIEKHRGKPFNLLISGIMPGIDYDAFLADYSQIMRRFSPMVLPGVSALLSELKTLGIPVFIISSGSRELVLQDLEATGLWHFVSRLWGCEDCLYHKPDPRTLDPVLSAVSELGILIDQTVYLGDSTADCLIASLRQLPFCAVLTGCNRREVFRVMGLPEPLIVGSFEDLLQEGSWLQKRLQFK
jgi:phosphoglycolate phosphatase-like HAD superfamily hydrolase